MRERECKPSAAWILDLSNFLPLNDVPNPLSGGNCALCQVVAPGAAHDIVDHKACESAEDSGSHVVEHWISAPVTEHGNSATRPMEYIAALGTRWPMTFEKRRSQKTGVTVQGYRINSLPSVQNTH